MGNFVVIIAARDVFAAVVNARVSSVACAPRAIIHFAATDEGVTRRSAARKRV